MSNKVSTICFSILLGGLTASYPAFANSALEGCVPQIDITESVDMLLHTHDHAATEATAPTASHLELSNPILASHILTAEQAEQIVKLPLVEMSTLYESVDSESTISFLFADPLCPYCKKLHSSLVAQNLTYGNWVPVGALGAKSLVSAGRSLLMGEMFIDERAYSDVDLQVGSLLAGINTAIFAEIFNIVPGETLSVPMLLVISFDGSPAVSLVSGASEIEKAYKWQAASAAQNK